LTALLILISYHSTQLSKNTVTDLTPTPTQVIITPRSARVAKTPTPLPTGALAATVMEQKLQIYNNQDQTQAVKNLANQLTSIMRTEDFDMAYSPLVNLFFVQKKTPLAEQKIKEFLRDPILIELYNKNDVYRYFNIGTVSVDYAQYKYEEKYSNSRLKGANPNVKGASTALAQDKIAAGATSDTVDDGSSSVIRKLLGILNAFIGGGNTGTNSSTYGGDRFLFDPGVDENSSSTTGGTSPGSSGSLGGTISPTSKDILPADSEINKVINEAGSKVGVPPAMLKAILQRECPSTLTFSDQQIAQYSQPGGKSPYCTVNECAAAGPFQITIGIDNRGMTTCGTCGDSWTDADACPKTWESVKDTIKQYGYTHDPLPWNIKDAAFASAALLKANSNTSAPDNWTQEQVYAAASAYLGNCSGAHASYCVKTWEDYQANKQK